MRKRFLSIVIALVLTMAMAFTACFAVACDKQIPDDSSSSSQSQDTSGGDITPTPTPDPDQPEDRSQYTVNSLMSGISDVYLKDLAIDSTQALTGKLDGFLLGDIFTEVMTIMTEEAVNYLPDGINLDSLDLAVYRGYDGNYYRTYSKTRVNACLNSVLNYKLDGSSQLTIDYALYGEKTLAYILFDYTPSAAGNYDRNYLLQMVFELNPVISGVMYTTLNEAKQLVQGTSTEKTNVILENFGEVSLGDLISAALPETAKQNKAVQKTLAITVNKYYELATSQNNDSLLILAQIYDGVYLSDVCGITSSSPGYIREIHTMTLSEIYKAIYEDKLNEYIIECAGTVTLDRIIRANIVDEATLSTYQGLYDAVPAVFNTTISELITAMGNNTSVSAAVNAAFGELYNKVKDFKVYGDVTVDTIVNGIISSVTMDEYGNANGLDLYKLLTYCDTTQSVATALSGLVVYEDITVASLIKAALSGYTTTDGVTTFDLNAVFTYIETTFAGKLDALSQTLSGKTYEVLKGLVLSWITDGACDYKTMVKDLLTIVYEHYLAPNGYTVEALTMALSTKIAPYVNEQNLGQVLTVLVEAVAGKTGEELDAAFAALQEGKTLTQAVAELTAKLAQNTANNVENNVVLEAIQFVRTYQSAIYQLAQQNPDIPLAEIQAIIAENTTPEGVNVGGVANDLILLFAKNMLEDLAEVVVIDYTDSQNNRLTFTVAELINAINALDSPEDPTEALTALFGNAKVGTVVELLLIFSLPSAPAVK